MLNKCGEKKEIEEGGDERQNGRHKTQVSGESFILFLFPYPIRESKQGNQVLPSGFCTLPSHKGSL